MADQKAMNTSPVASGKYLVTARRDMAKPYGQNIRLIAQHEDGYQHGFPQYPVPRVYQNTTGSEAASPPVAFMKAG